VLSSFAGLLRLASLVICLIVLASFAVFAVNQTEGASAHQQRELNIGTSAATPAPAKSSTEHKGTLHNALDETSNALTSPFSGVTSGSSSQWTIHTVNLLLALTVYGFGLGYLVRVIRIRFP
jgi:hypothetical protein